MKGSFSAFVMSIKSQAGQYPVASKTELALKPSKTSCDRC